MYLRRSLKINPFSFSFEHFSPILFLSAVSLALNLGFKEEWE